MTLWGMKINSEVRRGEGVELKPNFFESKVETSCCNLEGPENVFISSKHITTCTIIIGCAYRFCCFS